MFEEYKKYIQDNPQGYWFKSKLYGWGWTPAKWQGWVVLAVFIILVVFNAWRTKIVANTETTFVNKYLLQTFILTIILIIICYKTGEKPSWHWGNKNKKH
ncbi:MAG: hypothetical protein WA057_02545 [Candidatus Magasanikiibacteriota bacterium]